MSQKTWSDISDAIGRVVLDNLPLDATVKTYMDITDVATNAIVAEWANSRLREERAKVGLPAVPAEEQESTNDN